MAQYLDGSSSAYKDANGNNAVGAILVRKYVEPTSQLWIDSGHTSSNYGNSSINNFLNTEYFNKCSEEAKETISEINIPYIGYTRDTPTARNTTTKFFLMSSEEVLAYTLYPPDSEGFAWDSWKQRTGLTSLDGGANNGRIVNGLNGTPAVWWLRTSIYRNNTGSRTIYIGNVNGAISTINVLMEGEEPQVGVLPACFISS